MKASKTRERRAPGVSWDAIANRYRPLTQEEKRAALKLAQAGCQEARDRLILHNLRWLRTLARKRARSPDEVDDLISESVPQLQRAIDGFDLSRDVRFLTYAKHWVQSGARSWRRRQAPIVLPAGPHAWRERVRSSIRDHRDRAGRTPLPEGVSEALDITSDQLAPLLATLPGTVSLDRKSRATRHRYRTLLDVLPSEEDTEADRITALEHEEIRERVAGLEPRRRRVLELLYGLERDSPRSADEVGFHLGVTAARVRQLRVSALEALRQGPTDR